LTSKPPPCPWKIFDEAQREYLFREAEKITDAAARETAARKFTVNSIYGR